MSLTHLSLRSGRTAVIADIRLTSTYGDMLEGYPFSRLNDMKLSALLHRATRAFPDHPVHVVPPRRELPDLPAGAFGPVETLPPVAVIALLTSEPVDPSRDDVSFYSALAVVWLQDEPAFPSGSTIDPALLVLAWADLAQDYERQPHPHAEARPATRKTPRARYPDREHSSDRGGVRTVTRTLIGLPGVPRATFGG